MQRPSPTFPAWAWPLLAALYALAIPWWLPQETPPVLWFGAPRWVVTALFFGLLVALTVNALMRRYWTDE